MYYVYLLKSKKTGEAYIGFTADLKKRFSEHNSGKNRSTKAYTPWELVYYEGFKNREMARDRELKLKHFGQSLTILKKRVGF